MSRREEWLGILGGGQLGRMFVMAAQTLGYRVMVLDPDVDCPAGRSADRFLCGAYDAPDLLAVMVAQCAAVTIEFEGVPAESLAWLSTRCKVTPSAASVATAQDRIAEKKLLAAVVGVVPYAVIENVHDLAAVTPDLFPGILKTARMGYDGRGQATVADAAALAAAYERFGGVPCILEKRIRFVRELSVVLARSREGRLAVYPVVENRHVDGILDVSIAPAQVAADTALRARAAAIAVAEALDYHGVMCLELFELEDGRLFANEIAPRPHNSGHWSLDGCETSQFEQHVRAVCGLPLGGVAVREPTVMVNILGDAWYAPAADEVDQAGAGAVGEGAGANEAARGDTKGAGERPRFPNWSAVLAEPRAKLHLYGKSEPRRARKMGHFTVRAADVETALARARELKARL